MSHDYTENISVQEAAGHLLETELGSQVRPSCERNKIYT